MGPLGSLATCLLPAAILWAQPEPAPIEVKGPVPGKGTGKVRLQFKKGVQADASTLPQRFLSGRPSGWVPFEDLAPEGKRWVLETLFPEDHWRRGEVLHVVRWPELESVWLLATLFTGHGQNYDKLQAENPKNPEKLRKGDLWRVPASLLAKELGGAGARLPDRSQPEDELDDEARTAAFRAMLTFEEDDQGRYAVYRLRKGEALYSSVVMRFTERVSPREVNELALALARRSGIQDLRTIPPRQIVKIPLEVLAGPFQPEGTQALAADREMREEIRRTPRIDAGPRLKGVRIILDPGHGGIDKGASGIRVWESDFVFDIAMRVLRILQQDTDAQVTSTVRYPRVGLKARDRILAPATQAEVLTTPPFSIDGESPTAVSVNLRWVLANDQLRVFAKKGDPQKTLFLSLHADSLHPSSRGAMVYVPGAPHVPASYSLGPRRAAAVAEMKLSSQVLLSGRDRLQGEARSRQFAETLLRAFQRDQIPVHANRPIRNVIHRDGKTFVPAVILHSSAATKVLLEVLNLQNEEDAENFRDPVFRERYAEAVVKGIQGYFRK